MNLSVSVIFAPVSGEDQSFIDGVLDIFEPILFFGHWSALSSAPTTYLVSVADDRKVMLLNCEIYLFRSSFYFLSFIHHLSSALSYPSTSKSYR